MKRKSEVFFLIFAFCIFFFYSKESYSHLVQYLSTFEDGDADIAESCEYAQEAAIKAVKDPLNLSENLLILPALQNLEKIQQHKPLFELLRIFSQDKFDAYDAFYQENQRFIENLGDLLYLCSISIGFYLDVIFLQESITKRVSVTFAFYLCALWQSKMRKFLSL